LASEVLEINALLRNFFSYSINLFSSPYPGIAAWRHQLFRFHTKVVFVAYESTARTGKLFQKPIPANFKKQTSCAIDNFTYTITTAMLILL
jgi:hypothetical protein